MTENAYQWIYMRALLEKILVWTIRICCGAVFIVPLVITTSTFFPFIFGKIILFELLVEIAIACWIILIVLNPAYRPRKAPITIALGLFVLALAVTSAFGVDPFRSFWSTQERMTGVIAYAHFFLWHLLLVSCFHQWKEWRILLWTSLCASVAMAFFAAGQMSGMKFFGIAVEGRAIATLGNSIYIGVYGILNLFLCLILWIKDARLLTRCLLGCMILANLLLTLWSGSRAVMLVFVGFLVVSAMLAIAMKVNARMRAPAAAALLAAMIATGIAYGWLQTNTGQAWAAAHLPGSLQHSLAQSPMDKNRLELWRIGLLGFRDRPLTGWGLENFNAVYYAYAVPERNGARIEDAFFDRSHNQVVDILAVSGLIGAGAYLLLWISFFAAARKAWHFGANRTGAALLFLALGSYFLMHLTVFDTPSSLILFFALASLLAFFSSDTVGEPVSNPERVSGGTLALVAFGSAALLGAIIGLVIILPWSASTKSIAALHSMAVGNPGAALDNYTSALERRTLASAEIRRSLGQTTFGMIGRPENNDRLLRWLTYALSEAEKNFREEPREIRNHLLAGQLLEVLSQVDGAYLKRGEALMEAAESLAPGRIEVLIQGVKIAALSGDFEKARQRLSRALSLDPKSSALLSFRDEMEKQFPQLK